MSKFNVAHEEIVPISNFAQVSFTSDHAIFKAYSPNRFGDPFLTALGANITAADAIVATSFYVSERKLLTLHLRKNSNALYDPLNKLEGYVEFAEPNLTVQAKDFGISAIRDEIHKKNFEGLAFKLNTLNQIIAVPGNLAALTTEGFTNAMQADLVSRTLQIKNDITDRNTKTDAKEHAVQDNLALFTTLWDQVSLILKYGKRIFKYTDKEKVREYTLAVLKSRVKRQVHNMIVADQGGEPGEYVLSVEPNNFGVADFVVKAKTKYLISSLADKPLTVFFAKTPATDQPVGEKVILQPDDETILDSTIYTDAAYIIVVNDDPESPGEVAINVV